MDQKIKNGMDSTNTLYLTGCEKLNSGSSHVDTKYQSIAIQNIGLVGKIRDNHNFSGMPGTFACDSSTVDSVSLLSKRLNSHFVHDTFFLVKFNNTIVNGKSIFNNAIMSTKIENGWKMKSRQNLMQTTITKYKSQNIFSLNGRKINSNKNIKNGLYIMNINNRNQILLLLKNN